MAKITGLDFITAANGTKKFGVETITGEFGGIRISEDATIITEVLNHNDTDITTDMGLGAGISLFAGEIHTSSSKFIKSITCTVGSGVAINDF